MITRITLQVLLLPLVALVLPLMFGLAWVGEAIDDLSEKRTPLT